MGLRVRGLTIDMNKDVNNKNDLCEKYFDKKGQFPLVMLENQIRDDKFCFILFVLSALLCPTMKLFVKSSFLHLMKNINSIKKMNWAKFVLFYLVHEIEEFKRKQQSGVFGCLLFFMVMSLYIVNFEFVITNFVN